MQIYRSAAGWRRHNPGRASVRRPQPRSVNIRARDARAPSNPQAKKRGAGFGGSRARASQGLTSRGRRLV
eukprot:6554342-Prymnesium_polylepis.1